MSYEIPGHKIGTLQSGGDLSTKQFYPVKISSGKVAICGDGESILGILQNKPLLNEAAEIMTDHVSKAILGATVTSGAKLSVNASEKLIPATTGDYIVATALENGTTDEIIAVLIRNEGKA